MGRASCAHGSDEKHVKNLVGKNLKGRDPSKDLGVDGDNIRMDLREIGWKGMDWIHLANGRDQWRALVNTIMNLQIP
jgi:hypothetical protein